MSTGFPGHNRKRTAQKRQDPKCETCKTRPAYRWFTWCGYICKPCLEDRLPRKAPAG